MKDSDLQEIINMCDEALDLITKFESSWSNNHDIFNDAIKNIRSVVLACLDGDKINSKLNEKIPLRSKYDFNQNIIHLCNLRTLNKTINSTRDNKYTKKSLNNIKSVIQDIIKKSDNLPSNLQELYQVLKEISEGKKGFKPDDKGIDALKKFQSIARCLKEAEVRGYIYKMPEPIIGRGIENFGMFLSVAVPQGLTFKGEQILNNPEKLITDNQPQGFIDMSTKNINITGSTINNTGILNLGEINGNVSQTIQQLPAEQNDLKVLLGELQNLINASPLSDNTKQKALTKTQDIAEAVKQPEEEKKDIVEKTLGYFDGLADSLETVPEIATKLGETVAHIASLFGIQ